MSSEKKPRIVFALADRSLQPNGGFRIIAGYADHLQKKGFDVTLVVPGGRRRRLKSWVRRIKSIFGQKYNRPIAKHERPFLENSDVKIIIKDGVSKLAAQDFPEVDVYVATWWETVEWIEDLPNDVAKCHLIQGYEIFPYLPVERVHAVYKLPIQKIVVSKWLQDQMREHYQVDNAVLIENPIDVDHFQSGHREKAAAPRIGFLYSASKFKNCALAIDTINKLRGRIANLRGVSFGSVPSSDVHPMGDGIDYIFNPTQSEIPDIYRSCDVWLFTSDSEGFGLPILEAMACGTPVVATRAGAAPELVNSANGALSNGNVEEFANAVEKIINLSTDDWRVMSANAVKTAQNHDWPSAAAKFEQVMRESVAALERR